jgi:DNA invertase Pin-like site-specific DNA recombinase
MKVIIYARTSTKEQNIKEQIKYLIKLCNDQNWELVRYFKDEGISGLKDERNGLNDLINFIENKEVDKIIITEISRLSRDIDKLKEIIHIASSNNVSIYIKDIENETLVNGKLNTNIINILNDEIRYSNKEVDKLKKRLERGYRSYIENGGKVGRKTGYRKSETEFILDNEDVMHFLKEGYPVRMVMSLCNKSSTTVMKMRKILQNNGTLADVKKISSSSIIKKIMNSDDIKNLIINEINNSYQ